MELITIIVLPVMPSTWRNHTAFVIRAVIHRNRSCCSCYLIQSGQSMATQRSRELVGLEMGGPGSSMLVLFPVDFTSIRKKHYFYKLFQFQDPGSTPARRIWTSLDVGTEIFVSNKDEV
ncbi:hypothetical protein Pfo_006001, partial [Paulownia fortunei]